MDSDMVAAAIQRALAESGRDDSVASDVAFHMTDWLDDLSEYVAFCENPDESSTPAIVDMLMRFLVHAPNHLNAAHRLLIGEPVTDVFAINAVSGDSAGEG